MATLRANNVGDSDGTTNPITLTSAGVLTATWPNSPANMPAVNSPDILKITVEPNTPREEILYITAYTVGATSATVLRAQEGLLPAAAHVNVAWVHAPTALDFPGPAGPQGPPGVGVANPLTAVGDIIVGGAGGTQTRLPIGTNTYQLTVVSGTPGWVASAVTLNATAHGTYVGSQTGVGATGNGCTFVGYQAGQSDGSGYSNTFIGYEAGQSVTTGNSNTVVGANTGAFFVTGSNNTAVGQGAGPSGGDYSTTTAVGSNATVNNSNGTAVGYAATAGASSIAIGYTASAQVTNGVAIGNGASASANGAIAIGCDSTGASASSSTVDLAVIGTNKTLTKVAGLATAFTSVGSNYPMSRTDNLVQCQNNSAAFNVTLPSPSGAGAGAQYQIMNTGQTYSVTVLPHGSEHIQNGTGNVMSSMIIAAGFYVTFITDGTNWYTDILGLPNYSFSISSTVAVPSGGSGTPVLTGALGPAGSYMVTATAYLTGTGLYDIWIAYLSAGTFLAVASGTAPGQVTLGGINVTPYSGDSARMIIYTSSGAKTVQYLSQGGFNVSPVTSMSLVKVG